jgi:predicted site-specific integrase-resolvase
MTMAELQRPTVNSVQALAIAKICRRTLYNWMEAGRIEYVYTPTGKLRIYADTLLRRDRAA